MPSAVVCAAASSMSLHTTLPPRWASSVANAAPMPLPAPVMTAAALLLRFLDEPNMPMSPCFPAGGVVVERLRDEIRDVSHRGGRLRDQPGQSLEDVYLVRPDLQLTLAARGVDVGRQPSGVAEEHLGAARL